MKPFKITIDNGSRRQEFEQEYANEGYARMSLYHVMADMLDSAIREAFPVGTDPKAAAYLYAKSDVVAIDKPSLVGNAENVIND